jgi:hypothetical protein
MTQRTLLRICLCCVKTNTLLRSLLMPIASCSQDYLDVESSVPNGARRNAMISRGDGALPVVFALERLDTVLVDEALRGQTAPHSFLGPLQKPPARDARWREGLVRIFETAQPDLTAGNWSGLHDL